MNDFHDHFNSSTKFLLILYKAVNYMVTRDGKIIGKYTEYWQFNHLQNKEQEV